MTFWTNLCNVEVAKLKSEKPSDCQNIIGQHKAALLQIILQGLVLTELDDKDSETEQTNDDIVWTVSRASGSLLQDVTALLGDAVLMDTIQFASEKLNGTTWKEHYVGMIALGSVMEGPSAEAIERDVGPAYMTIFHMLATSQSSRVRQASAWLISQLVKNAPLMIFRNQENLKILME